MTDNSLYSDPKPRDEFRTESPLRGFAEYTEFGGWLIAKGFRPSMQHLVRYLAAMEAREGYRLVQILEAATGVPTMIFRTTARASLDMIADAFKPAEIERGNAALDQQVKEYLGAGGFAHTDFYKQFATDTMATDYKDGARKVAMSAALGAGYGTHNWPQISDFETDDEGEPWKLFVKFKDKRANFFRADHIKTYKVEIDHPGVFVVEWFDNETQTVTRRPVAEWPEWAQKLAGPAPVEAEHTIGDWTPPEGAVYGWWADGRFFITFPHGVGGETARLAAPPGYTFYGFQSDSLQKTAFYTEVTSVVTDEITPERQAWNEAVIKDAPIVPAMPANPVDVLEAAAEEIAGDLGIEVDRESFEVARDHLEEMVPVGYDIPDELKAEAADYVISRIKQPAYAAKTLREFKKSFMNPKGTPLPPHDKLDAQLQFIIGGGIDIVVIRNFLASFKMSKQEQTLEQATLRSIRENPEAVRRALGVDDPINPQHYNGRECADIGERLSANAYQILKYCWRLGKKDDPCQELGKALWYLNSEAALLAVRGKGLVLHADTHSIVDKESFLENRIAEQPEFTQRIARMLWWGYGRDKLAEIKAEIADHKTRLDCGNGLAI